MEAALIFRCRADRYACCLLPVSLKIKKGHKHRVNCIYDLRIKSNTRLLYDNIHIGIGQHFGNTHHLVDIICVDIPQKICR